MPLGIFLVVDKKELKSFPSEIQAGLHGRHLENLFFVSSLNQKTNRLETL